MASLPRTTFAAGNSIVASEMNTNFNNVENLINDVLDGTESHSNFTSSGTASLAVMTTTGLATFGGAAIFNSTVTAGTFTGALVGNATSATNIAVEAESVDPTCYVIFAEHNTGNRPPKTSTNLKFNSSTGALNATSFIVGGDDGLTAVTGSYGSVQTVGSGGTNYEGYSIAGRLVFMENGSDVGGIYDDVNSRWKVRTDLSATGGVDLYAGTAVKLSTTSAGAQVAGTLAATTLTATGDINVGSNGGGDSAIAFYDDNSNDWRTFMWDDSLNRFYFEGQIAPSGNIYPPVGTAPLPAYSFTSDPDTGMYRHGTNSLGFSTNGLLRLHIDSAGHLLHRAGVDNTIFYTGNIACNYSSGAEATIHHYNRRTFGNEYGLKMYASGDTDVNAAWGRTLWFKTDAYIRASIQNDGFRLNSFPALSGWSTVRRRSSDYLCGSDGSSLRYKDNVVDADETWRSVYNLRPVDFDWNNEIHNDDQGDRADYGLIAEETAITMPSVVEYRVVEGQGDLPVPDSVQYEKLSVYLIPLVQDLNARLEALEAV